MPTAVISDIHGNRHAFEAVLAAIADRGCERIWCLGDLVGYGADPNACVDLAREHAELCLSGNHDLAVIGSLDIDDFSPVAAAATLWTRETITAETRSYLEALSPSGAADGVGLFHASPRDPIWEYVLSAQQAAECFEQQSTPLAFIGHSHVALSFSRSPEAATSGQTRAAGERLDLRTGQWLLNPGSVGQPRDGDPRAAWFEFDADAAAVTYHRVDYDVEAAAGSIRAAGLPGALADRLRYGQ